MRSRAVSLFFECWLSIAFVPPPSQIFSASLRTWDIRSARKRIFASKRAEVGSTLVASRVPAGDPFAVRDSLRSAMVEEADCLRYTSLVESRNAAEHRFLRSA